MHYGRVAILWVCWVDAYGTVYPCGFQAAWLRIKELVDNKLDVEYAPIKRLEALLASPFPSYHHQLKELQRPSHSYLSNEGKT